QCIESGLLLSRRCELSVGVANGEGVVRTGARSPRIGRVDAAILSQRYERTGIVHHARTAVGVRDVVVGESQCVADLVGDVLATALHRELGSVHVWIEGRRS